MAVDFFFDPPTCTIPTLDALRTDWENVKDKKLRRAVAKEAQSLVFQRYLVESIRCTEEGCCKKPTWIKPLTLSVRGGAIKAAILRTASICEAVLRHHAERRGYKLPTYPRQRTFGKVLDAWKDGNDQPRSEVAAIWRELNAINRHRKHIHLHDAASDPHSGFNHVLRVETRIFRSIDSVLAALRGIVTP